MTAASEQSIMQALMKSVEAAARAKQLETTDVTVKREGTQIVLPEGMSYDTGIDTLQRRKKLEETVIAVREEVQAHPLDGAHALMRVIENIFGWMQPEARQTMFGSTPPHMVGVEVAFGETTQVIWGEFSIPGVEGRLSTDAAYKNGEMIFVISGKIKKKDEEIVSKIARDVREYVKQRSIYKAKAFRLLTDSNGRVSFDFNNAPRFMDLRQVKPDELILPKVIQEQVSTSIFAPIERTAECRRHGVPLKRGILLEGKYGTGKTLTANVTAKKCQDNGWTFIYLDRVTALKDAMIFARRYEPAVIFAEDLDRVVSGERDVKVDDVLNNIDGIDSKNAEMMVVLTTNDVNAIDKAMLRPGRLDAIISVLAPDAEAAERLMRVYGRGLIDAKEKLTEAAKLMDGQIPAVIREVVERSKLAAIARGVGAELKLTDVDLAISARAMAHHLKLMAPATEKELSAEEALGVAFSNVLKDVLDDKSDSIDFIERVADEINEDRGYDVQ